MPKPIETGACLMSKQAFTPLLVLCGMLCMAMPAPGLAEVLYNGIELPAEWPPRYTAVPTREPMMVPYLHRIPAVIPIDVGRQLFIDDFLIEPSTLRRTYHSTEYFPGNPVLKGDQPWESEALGKKPAAPMAMVFSDGVWYDPAEKIYKAWYMGGVNRSTCYATSDDGIHWTKPKLDVVPGTNIVSRTGRDSNTVWLDQSETDPARRYKMFTYQRPEDSAELSLFFSRDGIHWSDLITKTGPTEDRVTAFYNPFRKVWVYSIKENLFGRRRSYVENADVVQGAKWKKGEPVLWVGADRLDKWWDKYNVHPELYNLDAVAYESVLLGLFTIWPGPGGEGRPKPNQLFVGFSRDGFHWHRPYREPFVPVSSKQGDWNYGNVQSAGGCCLVVDDKLRFYVSGRAGVAGSPKADSGACGTGLATLRRDGFASLDAAAQASEVTTRPIQFKGQYLFVNVAAPDGELRVEVLDEDHKPIEPYTLSNTVPIRADSTLQRVTWKGADNLATLAGKPVRFRFHLKNGSLYSFWVTPDENGASHGYVAAGGPGFTGPTDTVGQKTSLAKTK
jgi:hypothetical protein